MKEEERNKLEDVFYSKLHDFEVDTLPDDWAAIAGRLPERMPVPFRRTLLYGAAAAVISLLVVTGSIFLYEKGPGGDSVAQERSSETEMAPEHRQPQAAALFPDDRKIVKEERTTLEKGVRAYKRSDSAPADAVPADAIPAVSAASFPIASSALSRTQTVGATPAGKERQHEVAVCSGDDELLDRKPQEKTVAGKESVRKEQAKEKDTSLFNRSNLRSRSLLAEAAPVSKASSVASFRKWGIGMGAGGLSVGADQMIPQYVTNSSALRSENLLMMNAVSFNADELPKTDVHHKVPLSFGLSVSRYLNKRFSLQTGLTYSFLSSDWKTNGDYHGKTKQKLHFIGIPLSLSYKIAEWNRFNFYAAAGGMTEVNVAGKRRTQLFSDTKEINSMRERVRMKEWLWSVNARAGVSYPLIRFVSAFAEVGASYYFDNGSSIETIHSEKPFNVSLQLGFRLGF